MFIRKQCEKCNGLGWNGYIMDDFNFDDIFAGYIIKDIDRSSGPFDIFVGRDSLQYRVARNFAHRFTKKGVVDYIKNNPGSWEVQQA